MRSSVLAVRQNVVLHPLFVAVAAGVHLSPIGLACRQIGVLRSLCRERQVGRCSDVMVVGPLTEPIAKSFPACDKDDQYEQESVS